MRNKAFRLLATLALAVAAAAAAFAYDLIYGPGGARVTWDAGQIPFVIRMSQTANLQDGSSYATSVQAAMSTWNAQVTNVQFAPTLAAPGLATNGDGINEIAFDTKIYSNSTDPNNPPQDFGENVLAVTLSWTSSSPRGDGTYRRTQSDILFNSAWNWDSYRGNLQQPQDIRRVAVHELGHVLGLDHPDQDGQSVTAIMNAYVSNIDSPQTDDLTGAQLLYGRPGGFTRMLNDDFLYARPISLNNNTATETWANVGGTKEPGEPHHGNDNDGASAWWRWTAPSNGTLTINTFGSNFDTVLAAYTGEYISSLTQVAANDDASDTERRSAITFNVNAGTTYRIAVGGWDAQWGTVILNFRFSESNVPAAPTFTTHPADVSTTEGLSAQFTAAATGTPAPMYLWQRFPAGLRNWENLPNGGVYQGVQSATLTISPLTAAMTGDRFRCVAGNMSGEAISNEASLTVAALVPPAINSNPDNITVNPGQIAQFTVSASGSAPLTYRWERTYRGAGGWSALVDSAPYYAGTATPTLTVGGITTGNDGEQFRCVVTNAKGSATSAGATLTVPNAPPRIYFPSTSIEVDLGGTVTLAPFIAGAAPLSYTWQRWNTVLTGENGPTLTITNATAADQTDFYLTATNAFGSVHQGIYVVVRSAPRINQGPGSITVDDGSMAILSFTDTSYVTATYRWQRLRVGSTVWEDVSGAEYFVSANSLWVYSYPLSASGDQFRCLVTNPVGTTVTPTATVTVQPSWPSVTIASTGTYAVTGSTVTLNATVRGTAPLALQWRFNGNLIADATGTSLVVPNFQAANAGTYSLVATNQRGSSSDLRELKQEPAPTITRSPFSQSVVPGSQVVLKVEATAYVSPLTYEWRRDGVPVAGANAATLTLSNVQANQLGSYQVIVSNPTGSAISASAQLAFSGLSFVSRPLSRILREGQSATISATAQGVGTVRYSWRRNRSVLAGQTSSTLAITNASLRDGGYYEVFAADDVGVTRSVFYVHVAPAVGKVFATGEAYYGVLNVPTNLTDAIGIAAGGYTSLAIKPDGTVAMWGELAQNVSVPAGLTNVVEVDCGQFTAMALRADGTVVAWGSGSQGIESVPAGLSGVVAIATGDHVAVALKADGTVQEWGAEASGSPVPAGLQDVVAVACGRFHVVALRSDGSIVSWGSGSASVPVGGPTVTAIATGWYHGLTLKADGTVTGWGDAKDYVFPTTTAIAVTASYINTQNYVLTSTGNLVGVGSAATVPADLGVAYAVSSGAYHSLILSDTTLAAPVIRAQPASRQKGTGDTAVFFIDVTGQAPINYRWQSAPADADTWTDIVDGEQVTGATTATLTFGNLALAQNGLRFRCIVSNSRGAAISNVATLSVVVGPPFIVKAPPSAKVAAGAEVKLIVQVSSPVPVSYRWFFNHVALPDGSGPALTISNFQAADAGVYSVQIENSAGSVSTEAVIELATVASISISPPSRTAYVGGNFTWEIRATSNVAISYQWRRNGAVIDGATGPSLAFSAVQLSDAGNYTVDLTTIAGTVTSEPATLTVLPATAPSITQQPSSRTVAAQARTSFSVLATGVPAPSYRWQRLPAGTSTWIDVVPGVSQFYSGETTPTLMLNVGTLLGNNGDKFRCIVSNVAGTVTSDEATLTIMTTGAALLTAGGYHNAALVRLDGTLWMTGRNQEGELGDGTSTPRQAPVQVSASVANVSLGADYTAILKTDGTLWTTGFNPYGGLGTGNTNNLSTPQQIASSVSQVIAGIYHTAFVKTDGTLWITGWNSNGQIGDGSNINRLVPVQVASDVTAVGASYINTMFVKTDGTLWVTGNNGYGQFGNGTTAGSVVPVQIGTGMKTVALGYYHSLQVARDGTLRAAGYNAYGQLGDGTTTQRTTVVTVTTDVVAVAAGVYHSVLLKRDGTVWTMGANDRGQLGDGTTTQRNAPVQVASGVASIGAGLFATYLVKNDGSFWAAGANEEGQLGDSTATDRAAFVQIASGGTGLPADYTHPTATNSVNATRLAVSWPHSRGALYYRVWRHTANDSSAAALIADRITGNFYADLTAVAGVSYYYWVQPVNQFGALSVGASALGRFGAAGVAPTITTPPATQAVSLGASVTFNVIANGTAPLRYQWRHGGIALDNATASSYSLAAAQLADAGTYDVVVTNDFGSTTSAAATLTVDKLGQTITFAALPDISYTTEPIALTATSSSSLPVSFTLVSGPATLTDNNLTLTAAGTVTVRASQSGNGTYAAGPNIQRTFAVTKAAASITLSALAPTYDGAAKSAIATTAPADLSVVLTYDGNAAAPINAGNYAVSALIDDARYQGSATGTLTIAKAGQSITFNAPADRRFDSTPIALNATSSSGLPVSFALVSGPAVLDGSTLTLTGAGTVVVRASQSGDANYLAASPVDGSFAVGLNFEAWRTQHFNAAELLDPAISGPTADPDGDGFANLVEYALGADPRANSAASAPQVGATASDWTFTYTRPADRSDLTYTVECSTNLVTWSTIDATRVSSANGSETWRAAYPLGATPCCFRLRVARE